ncbi:MAG: 50S ribosomal protein L22 [Bacteroidetes bacterium GWF2_41_31]|nr:MAG: 50S ribosomal protein L22 [Bacteroidetes bacterium GWF2_41_31]OFZ09822.1 MAG: 50S ribosomal protein L22 [Bacteroidetes bacterium RIFOXYB12_FULL_41_6]
MGSRKHISAEKRKEAQKTFYVARLRNVPTSPRKMRLVADLVRGMDVEKALPVLQHMPNEAAGRLYKLVRSAISNWEVKNEGAKVEDNHLFIKLLSVDGGRMLKRVQPAPQGRAHRVRKRSNHVTLVLDNRLVQKNEVNHTENSDN